MDPVKLQSLLVDWIRGALRQAEEILETKTRDSWGVVGKASIVLQLGQFNRRTDGLVIDGLDVVLTLGLVWYEQDEDFVFDIKNETEVYG